VYVHQASIGLNHDTTRDSLTCGRARSSAALAVRKLQTSLESPLSRYLISRRGNYKNNSDLYLTAYHAGESYLRAHGTSAHGPSAPLLRSFLVAETRPDKNGFVSTKDYRCSIKSHCTGENRGGPDYRENEIVRASLRNSSYFNRRHL